MQQKVFQSDVNCASQTTDDNLKTLGRILRCLRFKREFTKTELKNKPVINQLIVTSDTKVGILQLIIKFNQIFSKSDVIV
ncbi:hypothetical protein NQ318_008844 [Aromia moschata]|uniref:Uncharacterized protein n=1 Tax=Aromia moschata TaxID=1265417 RepID=A0AAV8ZCH3_9CUCU|nr:hypothetical protein NQ318_008844 [Aromia moschata]